MFQRDLTWIASATAGELVGNSVELVGVSTDSRSVKQANLFIPIVGEQFNGHQFVELAVRNGASSFLWEKKLALPDALQSIAHVLVDDTLLALQNLAAAYRKELAVKVVGVTGSNGKTTTKEMIALILSTRYRTYKSPGNLNNHIGLPLSLLNIPDDVEVAVFEMGMNHAGEIARLAEIAKPDVGVITMIGEAHIGFLGSREGIARAKWELVASLPVDGVAFLPVEEPLLHELTLPQGVTAYYFGESVDADINLTHYEVKLPSGSSIELTTSEQLGNETASMDLPFPGKHLGFDALAAIGVGRWFGVSLTMAAQALRDYQMDALRLAVMTLGDRLFLINDAYNAAPSSIEGAFKVMKDLPVDVRIVVLGDMLELGEHAEALHRKVGAMFDRYGIQEVIAVGDLSNWYIQGARDQLRAMHVYMAADAVTAADYLIPRLINHLKKEKTCAVLVKGSRKIGLEKVAQVILEDFPDHEIHTY